MIDLILSFVAGIVVGTIGTLFTGLMYQFYKIYQHDRANKNNN